MVSNDFDLYGDVRRLLSGLSQENKKHQSESLNLNMTVPNVYMHPNNPLL